jgi:glycosyltransferase involved in cell wall biosynthesis
MPVEWHISTWRRGPCELIVHDAYHRVLVHELIDGYRDSAGAPPAGGGAQPLASRERASRTCRSAMWHPTRSRSTAVRFAPPRQDYLLWIGRMDPVKGAHRAIHAARVAGRARMLAGGGAPSSSVQSFAAIACLRILEGGLVQDLGAGR